MSDTANTEIGEEALEQKLGELTINKTTSKIKRRIRKKVKDRTTAQRIRIEKEQKMKKLISTGLKGKVKWYSVLRRYGYITRDDGEGDVFVHQTAISKSAIEKFYLRTLGDEEEVVFDLVAGKNGPEAANVSGPDKQDVVGSKYSRQLLARYRCSSNQK